MDEENRDDILPWEKRTAEWPEVGGVKSSLDDVSGPRLDGNRAGKILG